MTVIVNTGSVLTVLSGVGLTISDDSTVESGGLLDGAGTIAGNVTLLNLGEISADVPGAALSVNTGTLTNLGTILGSGALLTINSSVVVTNLIGSSLTGGTWQATGIGTIAILTGQIVSDNATIILDGTSSVLEGFDSANGTVQPIENSLTSVGSAGILGLLSNRSFHASHSLSVDGSMSLQGGTLSAAGAGLSIGTGGVISGYGTIDAGTPVVVLGTIEASAGTLTVPGVGSVSGGGTLQVDANASLVLQAFGSYAETIVNNGTIDAAFGGLTGTLGISGAYSGAGGFLILGGPDSADRAILELPSGLSANVAFDPNFGELLLDDGSTFNGTIAGFGNNDTIVLSGLANAAVATLNGDTLSLKNAQGGTVQAITLDTASVNYQDAVFLVTENPGNTQATLKVVAPACFAAGTLIRTMKGDVPVEQLVAGDVVRAHFAGTTPIVWIGHRHIDFRRHKDPPNAWPVVVSAHAFGPRMPARDLVLSPDHAVYIDDVLIPIKHLVNGKTIVQKQVDQVTYYHVELGEHDVLLANGLPAESYLESGDRAAFDNAGGVIALHPDFGARRWEAFGCAPLVMTGEKLTVIASRLRARAAKDRGVAATSSRVA